MKVFIHRRHVWFASIVACSPAGAGTDDAGSSGTSSGGSTADSTQTGVTPTGDAPSTGEPSTGEPSTGDAPSTGEPTSTTGDGCGNGEPSGAPLWAEPLTPTVAEAMVSLGTAMALASDGRLAIAATVQAEQALEFAAAMVWASPDGADVKIEVGKKLSLENLETRALQLGGDGTAVLVGDQLDGETHAAWIARFAAGGAEIGRAVLATEHLNQPHALALTDAAVVVGHERDTFVPWLAKVDPDTGAVIWERELAGAATVAGQHVVAGPSGDVLVAHGTPGGLTVARIDAAGEAAWTVDVPALPGGTAGGLHRTEDGQVIALQMGLVQAPRVALVSLALADGATLWSLEVAAPDDAGDPRAGGIVADAMGLAIPIGRGPMLATNGGADPLTAALHRVSLTGALVEVTPLQLGGPAEGDPLLTPLRGACGQLFLLQRGGEGALLRAFAP